jgi:hypothetical protein
MSTTAGDPPPLLFGQRSSSPAASAPFSLDEAENPHSQPHRNPPHITATVTATEDIDMSTSTTLLPPGQNHDRETQMDRLQADADGSDQQHAGQLTPATAGSTNTIADAMDTTPDASHPSREHVTSNTVTAFGIGQPQDPVQVGEVSLIRTNSSGDGSTSI